MIQLGKKLGGWLINVIRSYPAQTLFLVSLIILIPLGSVLFFISKRSGLEGKIGSTLIVMGVATFIDAFITWINKDGFERQGHELRILTRITSDLIWSIDAKILNEKEEFEKFKRILKKILAFTVEYAQCNINKKRKTGTIYGINIMTYRNLDDDIWNSIREQHSLKFIKDNMRIFNFNDISKYFQGCLTLKEHLAFETSDNFEEEKIDSNVSGITLLIPKDLYGVNSKYNALPGAPLCSKLNHYNYYENTANFGEWCNNNLDLTNIYDNNVITEIKNYFNMDHEKLKIKSMYSHPVKSLTKEGVEEIHVLNIHANYEEMLGKNKLKNFSDKIKIYTEMLEKLLQG